MSNILNIAIKRSAWNLRNISCTLREQSRKLGAIFPTFLIRAKSLNLLKSQSQNYCTRALDVNTNVSKDIVLFKFENPKFFKILNIFGISQFVFWVYLSHFAFTTLRDAPVERKPEEERAWYERFNLGDNKYRNSITVFCFIIGYGILVAAWLFTLRSVRYLILRKGGKDVSFVTYTPFGQNRIMTVPLTNVSAQESREIARTQLPIKVKNRSLFYILDMRGEFKNPKLYDHTAGMRRNLTK